MCEGGRTWEDDATWEAWEYDWACERDRDSDWRGRDGDRVLLRFGGGIPSSSDCKMPMRRLTTTRDVCKA